MVNDAKRVYASGVVSAIVHFLLRAVTLFFVLLAICLLHRAIAVWRHYQLSVKAVYMPEDTAQGLSMLWVTYRESLLSGVSTDVLFSLIVACGLALSIFGKWLRVAAILLLVGFLGANLEHILYNFTHINLATAHNAMDMTFVKGQMTPSLGKALVVLLIGAALTFALLKVPALHRLGSYFLIPVLSAAVFFAGSFSFTQPSWMQTHPLLPNMALSAVPTNSRSFSESAFATVPAPVPMQGEYNILLIYMEGLSQKSVELGDMATLRALAEQNISFTRYLGNQIVTVNGLYTTLTGDLPYFLSKGLKWDELRPGDDVAQGALPTQLRRAGYHTAFLQSAHLDFMNKGRVLPHLGYIETLGREAWDSYYSTDGWGIDDRALFMHTLDYVSARATDQPWFVSVLTTGTHSPYNVPAEFMPDVPSDRYRALAYLDFAIAELMDGLQLEGLLDSTVVIFTSDESRENSFEDPLKDQLLLNWLPLIIRHPSEQRKTLDFYISSQRFPEIVSTFAKDPAPDQLTDLERWQAPFIMGNAYANRLFWFDPAARSLFSCDTQSFVCARFSDVEDPMTMSERPPDETAYYPELQQLFLELEAAN